MTMSVSETSSGSFAPPFRGSRELCALAEVGGEAAALLGAADPPPRAFLSALIEGALFADAVRFVAHALPRREAVWWAWVCARKAPGTEPAPKTKAALEATERWIVQPTEEHRRAAMAAGEVAELSTPAGCAALAAFLSSGSLAPPNVQPIPPGEFLTAKAVAGCVTLAAVVDEPEHAAEKFREFIGLGVEVADRTKLWPT
jgi:hypothetical protein